MQLLTPKKEHAVLMFVSSLHFSEFEFSLCNTLHGLFFLLVEMFSKALVTRLSMFKQFLILNTEVNMFNTSLN